MRITCGQLIAIPSSSRSDSAKCRVAGQVVIGGAPQRFVAASGGTDVSGTVTGGVLS
ncbi:MULTISPECIES: hypothetical protein [Rhodococcus]|uniref:hypothetical protein n=1 Tax=Rhodococcus TaxID=1827 RepID=UPI000309CEC5|nr:MULTISPECIES: hypothetical protein [Rhodococcus]MCW3472265.1 hypothetical protein [Rhodococcus pyridinivorans]